MNSEYLRSKLTQLETVEGQILKCTTCKLCETRTHAVPGEGPLNPDLMFIGEAPGFHEDKHGRPFIGAAGQLLEHLMASVGLSREEVYITNIVKCRPPNNRDPNSIEIHSCNPYLEQQIEITQPAIIVTLGRFSFNHFFPSETISKSHGQILAWKTRSIYPMYHPAAALHQPKMRIYLEEDISKLPDLLAKSRIQISIEPAGPSPEPDAQPRLF